MKMLHRRSSVRSGFTLIELLVVIAIIGILASIVLISLAGSTAAARDARITSEMAQIRREAEVVRENDGDYSNLSCNRTVGLQNICSDIQQQITENPEQPTFVKSADTYCSFVRFNRKQEDGVGTWYCISSNGTASRMLTHPGAGGCTTCPDDCDCDPSN